MASPTTYKPAWQSNEAFQKYDSASLMLFALALRYNIEDIDSLAASSLTDGYGDKCIDGLYLETDTSDVAVIIQAYVAEEPTTGEAPSKKASDLNTAVPWAFSMPVEEIPDRIRSNVIALRDAIEKGEVSEIEFWYVHNHNESENVSKELRAVEAASNALLEKTYGDIVRSRAIEIGNNTIESWYLSQLNPIQISDTISLDYYGGYEIKEEDWKSVSTVVPAKWLYSQFQTYTDQLFSANVRGYLGSRKTSKNINSNIKTSCESDPNNFWVYNNGITCLVHDYDIKDKKITIKGLSIVNGAQTTGAIGSLGSEPSDVVLIPTRFIVCKKSDVLEKIILFNNSQNKINTADFKSNDRIQVKLSREFDEIENATYTGRRGGARDAMKRDPQAIPRDAVARSLAAFHMDPIQAYQKKSNIWEDDQVYSKYFNDSTTAKHVVFTYSLLRAIEEKRNELRKKTKLTDPEENQLGFLRLRGAIPLFIATVSACMEPVIGEPIPNKFRLSFGLKSTRRAIGIWRLIINPVISFNKHLMPALEKGLTDQDKVDSVIQIVSELIEATKEGNKVQYAEFTSNLSSG